MSVLICVHMQSELESATRAAEVAGRERQEVDAALASALQHAGQLETSLSLVHAEKDSLVAEVNIFLMSAQLRKVARKMNSAALPFARQILELTRQRAVNSWRRRQHVKQPRLRRRRRPALRWPKSTNDWSARRRRGKRWLRRRRSRRRDSHVSKVHLQLQNQHCLQPNHAQKSESHMRC